VHSVSFEIPSKNVWELIENWDFNNTDGWEITNGSVSITNVDYLANGYSLSAVPKTYTVGWLKTCVFNAIYQLDSDYLDVVKGRTILFAYNIKLPSSDYYVTAYAKILYEREENPSPPGGGCPYVLSWDGSGYVVENNILPQAEAYPKPTILEDYYVLQHVFPLQNLKVKIVEFEREKSFIYGVSMYSILHPRGYYVTVDSEGKILFWTPFTLKYPNLAVNDKGERITGYVKWIDELAYKGKKGESIIVVFKNVTNRDNMKLIIRADLKTILSINLYILSATGNWIYIESIHPRALWSFHGVDLSPYRELLPSENITIKMFFTADHKIDFVGLDTAPTPNYEIRELSLAKAWHSRLKDVTRRLKHNKKPVIIIPGDELYLEFNNNRFENLTHTTTYILKVKGWYTKANKKEILKGLMRLGSIDPTYVAAESHVTITGNATRWYEISTFGTIPDDAISVKFEIALHSDQYYRAYIDVAKSKFMKQAVYSDFINIKLICIYAAYHEFTEAQEHTGAEMFFTLIYDATDFYSEPYPGAVLKWGIEITEINTDDSDWLLSPEDDSVGFDDGRGTEYRISDVSGIFDDTDYSLLSAIGTGLEFLQIGILATTIYSMATGVPIPYLGVVSVITGVASLIYTYYRAEFEGMSKYWAGTGNKIYVYVPAGSSPPKKGVLTIYVLWEQDNDDTYLHVKGRVALLVINYVVWQSVSMDVYI